jgi:P-type Mg2+ transporter
VTRTRRIPFYRSRPSAPLFVTTITCTVFGAAIPFIPSLAHLFGFAPLPAGFLGILVVDVECFRGELEGHGTSRLVAFL